MYAAGFWGSLNAMFIQHFAMVTAPVQCLLQGNDMKRKKFVWSKSCHQSFDNTIEALCNAPGLRIASTAGAYVIETDASGIGVAGCLYEKVEGILCPVWYVSHKFNSAERNYSPRDQEMLAVIYALRK